MSKKTFAIALLGGLLGTAAIPLAIDAAANGPIPNALSGGGFVGTATSNLSMGSYDVSLGADPADGTNGINLSSGQDLCWEASSTGTDVCADFSGDNTSAIVTFSSTNSTKLQLTDSNTYITGNDISGVSLAASGTPVLTLGNADVMIDGDGDGALEITGLGNGSDECLSLNLDDTANTAVFGNCAASTGVSAVSMSSLNIQTSGQLHLDGTTGNYGVWVNGGTQLRLVSGGGVGAQFTSSGLDTLDIQESDLTAGSCTTNQFRIDTGGATRELCWCQTTNTWHCISFTTTSGPTD